MKHPLFPRLTAAALSLALLLPLSARALTRDQAAQLLEELYVDPIPESVLAQPTIEEMLAALGDPYTYYFSPTEYRNFLASLSDGSVVGIGVRCQVTPEGILLSEVFPDSPAAAGGLLPGDLLIAADGTNLTGTHDTSLVSLLQGEAGTSVEVTVLRGETRFTVTLTRAEVVVPSSSVKLVDGHIGFITCTSFGKETARHFRENITAYNGQVNGWIVDLRNNSGGYTDAAVESAAAFHGSGDFGFLRDGENRYFRFAEEAEQLTFKPVIVLVNEETASAAELFSSIIRDKHCGIVIGTRTFGKGVAQTIVDQEQHPELFPDNDAIKITSHRFFSPEGNTTDQIGVIPDLLLPPEHTENAARLLLGEAPRGNTKDLLRLALSHEWTIHLDEALREDMKPSFTALLRAIPHTRKLWKGTGGADNWKETSPLQVAIDHGLASDFPTFTDLDQSGFIPHLRLLQTYDLIHGYEDGSFRPSGNLTRAELCQMLASALNCSAPAQPSVYSDVPADAWFAPAVNALSRTGLVNGVGGGRFDPQGTVDHQQLITIMGRMAAWMSMTFYNPSLDIPEEELQRAELAPYAAWARPQVWLLSLGRLNYLGQPINMLWEPLDQIDPTEPATRDEAAYTLCYLLTNTGILSV